MRIFKITDVTCTGGRHFILRGQHEPPHLEQGHAELVRRPPRRAWGSAGARISERGTMTLVWGYVEKPQTGAPYPARVSNCCWGESDRRRKEPESVLSFSSSFQTLTSSTGGSWKGIHGQKRNACDSQCLHHRPDHEKIGLQRTAYSLVTSKPGIVKPYFSREAGTLFVFMRKFPSSECC